MEHSLDVQTRLENLIWTVSGNYDLEISPEELDERLFEKSPYIAFYHAIEKGCFEKYFESKAFNRFFTKKVYQGLEPSVLQCLGKLCIDSAIWKKASKERKGILNIRKKAFLDTLEKDAFRLSHTDWEYIEGCYLEYVVYKQPAPPRIQEILEKIVSLENTSSTMAICLCLEKIYHMAYAKGFARQFKGLSRHVKNYDENKKEYTDKESGLEDSQDAQNHPVNIFSGHVDAQDNGKMKRPKSSIIVLDQDSVNRMAEYMERNYGKSCLTRQEQSALNSQLCTGIHKNCRLHLTKGLLHSQSEKNAKTAYVKNIKEENLRLLKSNQLVTRQNIQVLANTLRRALLTRTEREICSSEYGQICPNKLWNLNRTENRRLFQREVLGDQTDFVVEVLIDASGSQQSRQGFVALQAYIISEALSIVQIPHRVVSFCTFGAYTVLNEFRDYEDGREVNERIFEFYGSANNRDGLAVRAAAHSLDARPEENKILIVLSDGKPNDIIAGQDAVKYRKKAEAPKKKEPYCLEYAVKDTATEIRKLRNRKISVLGVFAGEEEDLQAEKRIFGKDFAYIRDISNFANVVGRYLRKQITL